VRLVVLLLSFFITGCAGIPTATQMSKIPDYESAWQIQEKNTWPHPKNVSIAIKLFYKKWCEEFGDRNKKVHKALNKLMIEWVSDKQKSMLGYSMDGKIKRGKAKGLALSPTYIKIHKTRYERIASTSLIHELVHVALWNSGNILGDPDHEGALYEGWTFKHTKMIKEINRILADIDI
tara:strand:- start:1011 stop:1544 length:534 start_codon:yes stop_codon:yes gene_type:complete